MTMSTDGQRKVRVTIEDPGGTDAALAWAKATHAKLMRSEVPANGQIAEPMEHTEAPECGYHHLPMVRMQGRLGPFWSCHEKNLDGSWCNFRPAGR